MNIYEYQAKEILKRYAISIPNGYLVTRIDSMSFGFLDEDDNSTPWVVKAQVHAGGRGKAGGVKVVRGYKEVRKVSSQLLGSYLVTEQTSHNGECVNSIYIENAINIERQMYLSFTIDRIKKGIVLIASSEGGVNIEEVSANQPDKISKVYLDFHMGIQPHHSFYLCSLFGLDINRYNNQMINLLRNLFTIFVDKDLALLEINPLVSTQDDLLVCLDCKISFDENSLFRNKDAMSFITYDENNPEDRARKMGFSYVSLEEGSVGCMVNGAGLAMATMDIIKHYGGNPSNFLDVGGGASVSTVKEALKIIIADAGVKVILVNIFGGIVRCDIITEAIASVYQENPFHIPLVLRLDGTNLKEAINIIESSDVDYFFTSDLGQAARKVSEYLKRN